MRRHDARALQQGVRIPVSSEIFGEVLARGARRGLAFASRAALLHRTRVSPAGVGNGGHFAPCGSAIDWPKRAIKGVDRTKGVRSWLTT